MIGILPERARDVMSPRLGRSGAAATIGGVPMIPDAVEPLPAAPRTVDRPLTPPRHRALRRRWRLALLAVGVVAMLGIGAIWTNALGAGERFERVVARIEVWLDPPPNRPTLPTVVVTPEPSPTATPVEREPAASPAAGQGSPARPTASPTPEPARAAVDVSIVDDPEAVFASQLTSEWCAVAGTQMVLAIEGLGDTSPAFQEELNSRIGEWESWEDSHDGGWGPAAVALALAAYGAPGYEIRAYDSQVDATRAIASAISETRRPVVLFPWWGAHTWVVTGYRADADPTLFPDANIAGFYVLDPWYPRVSSIWGPSDPPGNFEDVAELERNWPTGTPMGFGPGWSRPEGAYPDRDGKFIVLIPTAPLPSPDESPIPEASPTP
jgi:hypothetical protein